MTHQEIREAFDQFMEHYNKGESVMDQVLPENGLSEMEWQDYFRKIMEQTSLRTIVNSQIDHEDLWAYDAFITRLSRDFVNSVIVPSRFDLKENLNKLVSETLEHDVLLYHATINNVDVAITSDGARNIKGYEEVNNFILTESTNLRKEVLLQFSFTFCGKKPFKIANPFNKLTPIERTPMEIVRIYIPNTKLVVFEETPKKKESKKSEPKKESSNEKRKTLQELDVDEFLKVWDKEWQSIVSDFAQNLKKSKI